MKSALRLALLAFALLAALPAPLPAQTDDARAQAVAAEVQRRREAKFGSAQPTSDQPAEDAPKKFDLDFPGGTPAELVAAIEKASGRPLNAIIDSEYAAARLPSLRLHQVHVAQIFQSLGEATRKIHQQRNGQMTLTYEPRMVFLTKDRADHNSVWYFKLEGYPQQPEPITRFFPLAYYLQSGLTVDDITTAIRTSWEISGEAKTPTIKFHQETQLLIAVGQPEQLAIIGDVLEALKTTVRVRAEAAAQTAAHEASAH